MTRSGGEMARRRRPAIIAAVVALALAVLLGTAAATGLLGLGDGPTNDTFDAAETVLGAQLTGTTEGATVDDAELAAGAADVGQRAVWFTWTAAESGWTTVAPVVADAEPPSVRAFVGESIDDLDRIDQAPTGAGPAGTSIPAVAGTTYRLAVADGGNGGPFDLELSVPGIGIPTDPDGNPLTDHPVRANDEAVAAVSVAFAPGLAAAEGAPQTVIRDTLDLSTVADDEPRYPAAPPFEHSLWYVWEARTAGEVGFQVTPAFGSTGALAVQVFRQEDDGTLSQVPGGLGGGPVSSAGGQRFVASVVGDPIWFELTVTSGGIAPSDTTPPVVECDDPPTGWAGTEVISVGCTATDPSGLVDPAADPMSAPPTTLAFALEAEVADGVESETLTTGSRTVCDLLGNCSDVAALTGLRADRAAPVVTCTSLPAVWSAAAPSVTCQATDGGSGVAGPAEVIFTGAVAPGFEGEVSVDGGQVCDQAGNCTEVGPFGPGLVDAAPPVVTCDPAPAGVQRDEVRVTCRSMDAGAGLADGSAAQIELTTGVGAGNVDPAAGTDSRDVCDLAGNCTTAGPVTGISIDRAAPSVTCEADDDQPVDAWRAEPFGFSCTATDEGSGLADPADATFVLPADLAAGQESAEVVTPGRDVCDLAGNCTSAGPFTGLRIDRKAPVVTCPPASDDWQAGPASVSCAAVDDGAGVDPGDAPVVLTADGTPGQEAVVDTGSATVCDLVGNCAPVGPVTGLKVDRKPPVVTCDEPADAYAVEARIRCQAADTGAGLTGEANESFVLVTTVGAGNQDPAASTDRREVCDAVGNCATAGPFTVDVDLTDTRPGGGPPMQVPRRVTVVSTLIDPGPTPVPYELPSVPEADEVACRPGPETVVNLGWTTVVCEAVWPAGTTLRSFPLVAKALPTLGASTVATTGGAWRAVGVGYQPGSSVRVTIDDRTVATGTAGPDGRVALTFDLPADLSPGAYQQVVRGTDRSGDPLLTVGPLSAVGPPEGEDPPTTPPHGAPDLPTAGPDLPVDPVDRPAQPDLGDPGSSSSSSSTSSTVPVCDFTDVPQDHPFRTEIGWMASSGISTGYADCTFRPSSAVSRQAMAAFLYRWAGSPAVPPEVPSFSDVPAASSFSTPIRWMAWKGYSNGYSDGTYRPAAPISRQAMAAFLHRIAGTPAPAPGAPNFSDVPSSHPFRTPIRWLAGAGITNGYSDGTFRPTTPISRQAMAAFLYRYDQEIGSIDGSSAADEGLQQIFTDPLGAIREPEGQSALAVLVVVLLVAAMTWRRRQATTPSG